MLNSWIKKYVAFSHWPLFSNVSLIFLSDQFLFSSVRNCQSLTQSGCVTFYILITREWKFLCSTSLLRYYFFPPSSIDEHSPSQSPSKLILWILAKRFWGLFGGEKKTPRITNNTEEQQKDRIDSYYLTLRFSINNLQFLRQHGTGERKDK